ncbi:hypothetical protein F53441_9322 [Fusarium austroafricanum]|uniref:Ankyrin repeat protein n=1 Tax=Fusarium austroafricanum TaxID=2364996 RepID=A0A8H4NWG3_9HYPO|nr:hypothetical protein F53441_9322 [Fusarium austroafricanum]
MLLDHGADPNLRNGRRNSSAPIHIAVKKGDLDVTIELLKRGTNPYPDNTKESDPFHTACFEGWLGVIETFLEVVDDTGELVNFEWGCAGTPLRAAASGGNWGVVKLLLSRGADPNFKSQSKIGRGKTVIHAVAERGNIQVSEAILDTTNDSSLEIRDRTQRTPLWYACAEGREDMAKYLLQRGASTDVTFAEGKNIIPAIVLGGPENILKLVLENNPNLDTGCVAPNGETPLFHSVNSGDDKIVLMLLERGADVNRRSKYEMFRYLGLPSIAKRGHCRFCLDMRPPTSLHETSLVELPLKLHSSVIALQRSVRAVDTAPLVLEHENYCDVCFKIIVGTRDVVAPTAPSTYVIGAWMSLQSRDVAFAHGTTTPKYKLLPGVISREQIEFYEPSRLSSIEEEALTTGAGEPEATAQEHGDYQESGPQHRTGKGLDGGSVFLSGSSNNCTTAVESLSKELPTAVASCSLNNNGSFNDGPMQASILSKEEWSDRTEDELREFLDSVLKTFTTDQTRDEIVKWNFSVKDWELVLQDDAMELSQRQTVGNSLIVRPVRK